MALHKTTRPLPRTPRVTARTPLLKRAQSTTATTTISASGTLPIASLAPDVANGNAPPVAEDDVNDILTVALRDKILATVTETVRLWLQLAHFDGVTIQAVSATGAPGCLRGPRLRDDRKPLRRITARRASDAR